MTWNLDEIVKSRLSKLLSEIEKQSPQENHVEGHSLSFEDEVVQIREFIEHAGEYSLAYESIVSILEQKPIVVSGTAAVGLLEVGLVMGYKTEVECDKVFDRR